MSPLKELVHLWNRETGQRKDRGLPTCRTRVLRSSRNCRGRYWDKIGVGAERPLVASYFFVLRPATFLGNIFKCFLLWPKLGT